MAQTNKAEVTSFVRWLVLLTLSALWCVGAQMGWLQFLENKLLDFRFKYRSEIEAPVKLIYVDVDTKAVEKIGERPWSRSLYANVAEALLLAGEARAVGFDFVLSEISASGLVDKARAQKGNEELSRVIREYPRRVVLAAHYTTGEGRILASEKTREVPLIRKGKIDPKKNDAPETPLTEFTLDPKKKAASGRIGLIDVDVEYSGDDVPRWVPLFTQTRIANYFHLSLQLVLQHLGLEEDAVRLDRIHENQLDVVRKDGSVALTIPLRENQLLEANWFSRWNSLLNPRVSLAEVIDAIDADSSDDPKQQALSQKFFSQFKDALVLIGPVDPILQDLAPTPFDSHAVPKVGLHGNLVKTILSGKYLRRLPDWTMWMAVFGLTIVVSILSVAGGARGITAKFFALVALGGYAFISLHLFANNHLVLPMAAPLGAAFTTSFVAVIWQLVIEEKQKGRIRGMFSAYLAPTVVNSLIESGKEPELGGHEAEITAYFSDIQSFSSFSEKMTPARLVELMNEYLTACTDIVQEEGGTLDKYIGDAVVAMYGAPLPLPDHAHRAVLATIRVQKRIEELRQKWRSEGDAWPLVVHNLRARLGLNSGPAIIGNMGSRTRFSYTMMGDNVNLAARMESGAKSLGVYTMITGTTREACEKHSGDKVVFRFLDKLVVKGRSFPVAVHEVVGLRADLSQQTMDCLGLHTEGMQRYLEQNWDGAVELFQRSAALEPYQKNKDMAIESNPSLIMLERCEHMKHHPPGSHWDGVYVMKEK
jgi:adenylate cyclase